MSTATPGQIKGVYQHLDCLIAGVEQLRHAGFCDFEVLTPLHCHEIDELLYQNQPSPVRWWALVGSILGAIGGILLTTLSHLQWGLSSGGMPIISVLPFAVITFECIILLGAIATFLGMVFHGGLPGFFVDRALKDPRMTEASFGVVFLGAKPTDIPGIVKVLTTSGATEVTEGVPRE